MGRTLNHNSDIVTQETNTTGELTPILTVDPTDGTLIRLFNMVAQGAAAGLPIYASLQDSNGNDLPVDTTMVLSAKQPGDSRRQTVSVEEDNISTYLNKTVAEQQNVDNIDAVKHELQGKAVNIRDVDDLAVEINSSAQIDWSNSSLYVERSGVEEHQRG
jgi:hypothetical protein